MTVVLYAVEGSTDAPIAEKLIQLVGRLPRQVSASGGAGVVDSKIARWAKPSNRAPMLILRDWDSVDGVECAPRLVQKLAGPHRPPNVAVRVVVRSIESWLMADRDAASAYFRTSSMPTRPENLERPKLALVRACKSSRLVKVRSGMVPREGSGGAVGADFAPLITEFAREHWDPMRAAENAPSLGRAIDRMHQLVADGIW
jgi:predicted SnoaL-like aldol condensation-catalyzing enzyme